MVIWLAGSVAGHLCAWLVMCLVGCWMALGLNKWGVRRLAG